ncbi:hypothetical protein H9L39_18864 [Fusarium oxysporum f. sp. albedinis]|nr:hypothetical protein H9L39_18864 [Fusarium oxysporum f. sp. albedinis]
MLAPERVTTFSCECPWVTGKTCELEELSLRLGGLSHLAGKSGAISSVHHTEVMANSNEADEPVRRLRSSLLENVMNHGKMLRLLVLDIREVIDQPQSCMRFDLYGVQKLIGSCPKIEFIGMPVNLQASGGQRYRRMNYEPFRNRSDFEIFIGHYDKLRKVSFNLKGERKFLNVKEEEVKFSVKVLTDDSCAYAPHGVKYSPDRKKL